MAELDELTEILVGDVSDDDFLLLFDVGGDAAGKVTRASLLSGVAFAGGNHSFGTSSITSLTASSLTAGAASITTSFGFSGGATITKILTASDTVTPGDITNGNDETVTLTVTGALTTDHINVTMGALPAGLIPQFWVSAADTISIRLNNVSGGTISSASYAVRAIVTRTS